MIAKVGQYDRERLDRAEYHRGVIRSGQNVAPIPAIPDAALAERIACSEDFARFCKTYFPAAFKYPFSPDHYRVIEKIQQAVLRGALAAFAMPRGFGKTAMSKAAALWAILYGHRRWVVMIGATGPLGVALLKTGIKPMLQSNAKLAEAFPHTCIPARAVGKSAVKANGLHHDNVPCHMSWEKDTIVLPYIDHEHCLCGESRVTCFGIEGAIRGQVATLNTTGEEIRPDLVLVDDPQTKASARSKSQTTERYEIIMGDILGLAGGDVSIAGLIPCTVIQKDDLAEQLLAHPEMHGERTKLVYDFPSDESLWTEYFRLHSVDPAKARELYLSKQEAMDAGCKHAWPERYPKEYASAIEYAMYLRYREPGMFAAEYQNEPVDQSDVDCQFSTAQQIVGKVNSFERGTVPEACTHLTAFIDVQQDCLYWVVAGWEQNFTGYVIDFNTFPKQHQTYFTYRNLRHTLAAKYKGMGAEAAIFKGITELCGELLDREFPGEGGTPVKIGRILVDSGDFTKTVGAAIKQVGSQIVMPSKGRGIKAGNVPMGSFQPRPGERLGDCWIEKPRSPTLPMRYVEIDTNSWKTFTQLRLATNMGDAGCLSFFKATPYDLRCIADHLTAEKAIRTEGQGRRLFEWVLPPSRPDNHWADCMVGCAVGASMQGCSLKEHQTQVKRQRISLAELKRRTGR